MQPLKGDDSSQYGSQNYAINEYKMPVHIKPDKKRPNTIETAVYPPAPLEQMIWSPIFHHFAAPPEIESSPRVIHGLLLSTKDKMTQLNTFFLNLNYVDVG